MGGCEELIIEPYPPSRPVGPAGRYPVFHPCSQEVQAMVVALTVPTSCMEVSCTREHPFLLRNSLFLRVFLLPFFHRSLRC